MAKNTHKKTGVTRLVVIGAATALLEIIDLLSDINAQKLRYEIIGALDDDVALHGQIKAGVPVLGPLSFAAKMDEDVMFVFGIGSYTNRLRRIELFKSLGIPRERFVNLIHPTARAYASISKSVGCLLYNGVLIMSGCQLGDFVVVYGNTVMSPFSRIDDFALFGSLVFLGAYSHVGSGTFFGASSSVNERTRIGPGAMIGFGSTVLHDVEPGATVVGNPGRVIKTIAVPEYLIESWKTTS